MKTNGGWWTDCVQQLIEEGQYTIEDLKNAYIILVDDVFNSGKTMQFALVEILQFPTKAIKTVALVDRKHRRFPINANFVGLSLSTTLKDRVEVDLTPGAEKAYLV